MMRRYDIAGAPGFPGPAAAYENHEGSWCRYEDVEAELAALRECVRAADAMRDLYAIAWRERLLEADAYPQSIKDYDAARAKVTP